jgi:hypothetical protein
MREQIVTPVIVPRSEYEHLRDENARLRDEIVWMRERAERAEALVRQAFSAIDNPILHKGPKHFTRYPCTTCGGEVSNAGFARKSHERGKVHQAALASSRGSSA